MSYLNILPDELYTKIYKNVYDDSVNKINSIDFFPLEPITKSPGFCYCYIKKNNRVLLYCDFFSNSPVHTDIEYVYIDFTIHKSTYVIHNCIMFYYTYAKRRYDERNIVNMIHPDIIRNYLIDCGYSPSKRIIFAYEETPIPVNVIVFFQKCMSDNL